MSDWMDMFHDYPVKMLTAYDPYLICNPDHYKPKGEDMNLMEELHETRQIPLKRKEIRHELKSLKSDLRQLAAEACYKDRAWGEQIGRMADRVGEMVEKI